jgi:hypothetical protein
VTLAALLAASSVAAAPPPLLAPTLPRGITRVRGAIRPFVSVIDQGAGAIADLSVDHYFARAPLRLWVELAPVALALQSDGPGSIAHLRLGAAYAADYLELGAAAGGRFQRHGRAAVSLAGTVRVGALDGYKLTATYGHALLLDGTDRAGKSNVLTSFDVPIARSLTIFVEGGFSTEWWLFGTAGLRHRLSGEGGAGTWIISGAFGLAWVFDQADCGETPGSCGDTAWAAGPTLGFGLERRF